jgi:DNA adenine methylase
LKWVGGKGQLLPQLRRFYPASFGAYVEPFFGGGSVFFDLHRAGRLSGHDVVLIDSNSDLIGCYEAVRDAPEVVVAELERLAEGHARGGSEHYYAVRDQQFNPERQRRRAEDGRIRYTAPLAAMLIYLNRTGFNGLFRVNAKGAFNVPAGRYARPRIVDRERLMGVAAALGQPRVRLVWGTFDRVGTVAQPGDFVYFDPPYSPLSRTASFTSYTAGGFDGEAQRQLQRLVLKLAARGCQLVLSNSTAEDIVGLYDENEEARSAGLRAVRVPARRAVNSNALARGSVEEYVITNVPAP